MLSAGTEAPGWVDRVIPRLKTVPVGPGIHYLQESVPTAIGTEASSWISTLPAVAPDSEASPQEQEERNGERQPGLRSTEAASRHCS